MNPAARKDIPRRRYMSRGIRTRMRKLFGLDDPKNKDELGVSKS